MRSKLLRALAVASLALTLAACEVNLLKRGPKLESPADNIERKTIDKVKKLIRRGVAAEEIVAMLVATGVEETAAKRLLALAALEG